MIEPEIFTSLDCGWAQRNYAALLEKAEPFLLIPSRDPDGEKTEEFASLTPIGLTPVLRHGTNVVLDSNLINLYIDSNFAGQQLMPADSIDATAALCQMHYCDHVLHSGLSNYLEGQISRDELRGRFEVLNRNTFFAKSDGPYWYGNQLTLVDIAFATLFQAMQFVEQRETPVRSLLRDRILEWESAISQRDSIVRSAELAGEFHTTQSARRVP